MSGLRVIAGAAKGRKLKMPPGEGTRPVMDRVKEALFNILGEGIEEATFLDLFAGSGSVGIEALSRGAARAKSQRDAGRRVRTGPSGSSAPHNSRGAANPRPSSRGTGRPAAGGRASR